MNRGVCSSPHSGRFAPDKDPDVCCTEGWVGHSYGASDLAGLILWERRIQGIGGETRGKEITWKTQAQMGE